MDPKKKLPKLPEGWTWEDVERERKRWHISDRMIPLASAGGACAWGVPEEWRLGVEARR